MTGILILNVHKNFVGIVSTISQHHAASQMDMGEYFYRDLAVVYVARG